MALNRQERVLHHQKQDRAIEQVGIPKDVEGHDGDQRYCRIGSNLFLLVKSGGKWYNTATGSLARLKKAQTITGANISEGGGGYTAPTLGAAADYDSGWKSNLGSGGNVSIIHGLNCLLPRVEIYIRDAGNRIFLVSHHQDIGRDYGVGVRINSADIIELYTGEDGFLEYENAGLFSGAITAITAANYRILLWNTGITE